MSNQSKTKTVRAVLRMLQEYHLRKQLRYDPRGYHQARLDNVTDLLNGKNEMLMADLEKIWFQTRQDIMHEADAINAFMGIVVAKIEESLEKKVSNPYTGLL